MYSQISIVKSLIRPNAVCAKCSYKVVYIKGEVYKVEVKEPPQGVTPPSQNMKKQQRKQVYVTYKWGYLINMT